MVSRRLPGLLLALLVLTCACARQPEPVKHYDLTGKVVSVDANASRLVVDHGDIPGFMDAMTMGYPVKDAAVLKPLQPGDQISANVVVQGTDMWLENIHVTAKADPAEAKTPQASPPEHQH